ERARRMPEEKTLLCRDPHLLFAGRLCLGSQSTMMVKPTCVMQCILEAKGLVDRAGEFKHLAVELQRLVRKTEVPQGQRQIATVSYAGILAYQRSPKRGALAVVKIGDGSR